MSFEQVANLVEQLHADLDHESRRHSPSYHYRRASADRRHHPTASLGAVVAKGHCDLRRDRQRADRKDLVGLAPRRQDAFTDLLLTVCVALRNYRTIRIAHVTNLFRDPVLKAALEFTDAVTEALQRAVAGVE